MSADVCVVGAGIVGITTALELQERGLEVILVDRSQPGMETSFGNAGILSVSTVLNVNNPGLFRKLPILAAGRSPYFDYDLRYTLSRAAWLFAFLRFAMPAHSLRIAKAVQSLQRVSIDRHRDLIERAGATTILNTHGWLKVYRDATAFKGSGLERHLMHRLGVEYEEVSSDEVQRLEPALSRKYEAGLLLTETCSVSNPFELAKSYLALFERQGGEFRCLDVDKLEEKGGWQIRGRNGDQIGAEHVVLACGPWAPELCMSLGYKVPMAWERGYHAELRSAATVLRRPVLESQCGFVMAPRGDCTRITSGVEFAHRDAPPSFKQIRRAVAAARKCADLGKPVEDKYWVGSRPTLPDGLPVLGAAGRHRKLWFNFGHQHIGMSTSTGCAGIVADQLIGKPADLDVSAYAATRFGL